jgi:GT2 family glycosyltransferase
VVHPNQSVLVSVIMPLYNAEHFVAAAISSVLYEQHVPLEVIVVDNGSTDRSVEKVKAITDRRLRLISSPTRGIAAALNAGLAEAQGKFLMRCDSDDLYPAARILQQVEWLNQHPEFGAICGGYAAIDTKGAPLVEFNDSALPEEITAELSAGFVRTHFCTYALRTEIARSIGGFRPYFTTGEDIDFQLRLGEACRVRYQPGVYYQYRLHRTSITHTRSTLEREFFDKIARQFQRQRQLDGLDDLDGGQSPSLPELTDCRPLSAAQHIQKFLLWRAWYEHQAGQKWQAVTTGMRSVLTMPSSLSAWKSLVSLALKPCASSKLEVAKIEVVSKLPAQFARSAEAPLSVRPNRR